MTTNTSRTVHLKVEGVGPVDVDVAERGQGRPYLVLHGGAGPQSVSGFADLLAEREGAWVITPTHPGFGVTPRPDALHTVRGLAALYAALLDELGVDDVTVIGNSLGGWIAAELGLLQSTRVLRLILVGAVGIVVEGHPIADFFSLTLDQVFALSYHDPEPFRIDLTTLPPAAQQIAAANRSALARYAGSSMNDPSLLDRLHAMSVPTLVLSGESDQIVDPAYGAAFADAIPTARFQLLAETGHVPQVETPDLLLAAVRDFR